LAVNDSRNTAPEFTIPEEYKVGIVFVLVYATEEAAGTTLGISLNRCVASDATALAVDE
jgi:hypothetical protein